MNEYHEDDTQVEFITIVEGPVPDFLSTSAEWPWSVREGADNALCAVCKLRTFNADTLVERCRTAWAEDRPVRLDYPDGEGGREEADIVAVRKEMVEEGGVLYLWVCL